MPSPLLRFSEAVSIALHAMVLLAGRAQERISTAQIASVLDVSEAHLSKVLQRLAKAGLTQSVRGPKGGFLIGAPAEAITLLAVYEAIEGTLEPSHCLFARPVCRGGCILGGLVASINTQVRDYLAQTRLSDLAMGSPQPDSAIAPPVAAALADDGATG